MFAQVSLETHKGVSSMTTEQPSITIVHLCMRAANNHFAKHPLAAPEHVVESLERSKSFQLQIGLLLQQRILCVVRHKGKGSVYSLPFKFASVRLGFVSSMKRC